MKTHILPRLLLLVLPFKEIYAETTAQSVSNSVSSTYKNNFQAAVADPITGKSEMKTIDGSKSFDSKVTCGASKSFMRLDISLGAGSEAYLSAQVDKNLDGTKEYSYQSPHISGVCQDGIVSCDTGTWNNCKFYKWQYNNGIGLTQVPLINNLGGCFCTNASCGSLASTNKSNILESIGAGLFGVMSSSGFGLTKTSYNQDGSLEYYGQSASQCGGSKTPAFAPQTGFSFSGVDEEVLAQSANPNSAYTAFQSSIANTSTHEATCTIRNTPTLQKTTANLLLEGAPNAVCMDHYLFVKLEFDKASGNIAVSLAGASPSGIIGWNCGGQGYINFINTNISTTGIEPRLMTKLDLTAQIELISGAGCVPGIYSVNIPNALVQPTQTVLMTNSPCGADGAQIPTIAVKLSGTAEQEKPIVSTSNNCGSYANDDKCQLKSEEYCNLDGSQCSSSYSNFTPLNSTSSSCENLAGDLLWTICSDAGKITAVNKNGYLNTIYENPYKSFFLQKRTYRCTSNSEPNMDDMSKRYSTVRTNTQFNTADNSFTYKDTTKNSDGSWSPLKDGSGKIQTVPIEDEQWCEVKWQENASNLFSDGTNKSQLPSNKTTWKFERRACVNNTCPVDAGKGEIVTYPCDNNGDLAESVAMLDAVGQAAKDMICSLD